MARVVVLGASAKPERYSNKAVKQLQAAGHEVIPVHPALTELEGLEVKVSLGAVVGPVDTVTLYINGRNLQNVTNELIELKPERVIFNPGTEDVGVKTALEAAGIACLEACTLVLLSIGKF